MHLAHSVRQRCRDGRRALHAGAEHLRAGGALRLHGRRHRHLLVGRRVPEQQPNLRLRGCSAPLSSKPGLHGCTDTTLCEQLCTICAECLTAPLQKIIYAPHLVPCVGSCSISAEFSELDIPRGQCSYQGRDSRNSIIVRRTLLHTNASS